MQLPHLHSSHHSKSEGLPHLQKQTGTQPAYNINKSHKEWNKAEHSSPHIPQQPMTPAECLKQFRHRLTIFEQSEILDYPDVYFLGLDAKKIDGVQGQSQNNGYDDENGSYLKVMHDHLAYRYEMLEVLGKGSFGQVVKCIDHKTGNTVAVKIIRNKKRFHHQALVEVKILDALRRKDKDNCNNVIHMGEYFYFRNHLCITFELMG